MRGFSGIVAAALLLAGCGQPAALSAGKAWVRLPAVAGRPGAAYFTIQGGAQADTLLAVSTPAALRAELHETMDQGGVKSMRPTRDVPVPAKDALDFTPGGRHVMLFDLGPNVKPGTRVPLALAFASGKKLEVQAQVVGAGDPPPTL
ncbi:copper chaperone PCu(A)C [Sphingomonas gei]|uniref:Copper chaperone PCu(A)C n=1 Tax=Sphingomonas gei TaxID=1395960 RepID=A0A4S1X565_9SPHN|nr:copper chaperone PCu(A)C [Sphingomonas gei]TGX50110.1 copper chaperone PCu(A)C [Sphingomonas gei]